MSKVLVADDDPAILELLRLNLELAGHRPLLASDGATTLRRIESEAPDVVLLDVMMPVLDGWEVLSRLEGADLRKQPRVIVMTAKGGASDIAKGLRLGGCEYVTKPFEVDDLLKLIEQVVGRSDEENERRRAELLGEFGE